ncbi:MAG: response regulator transcription factor [Chitinophagaceae bacterium]|nr:response regulator transcription factor [Chitinophagaceae bacterium]
MTKQFTCVIVDDEELDRLSLQAQATRFSFLAIGQSFSNALEAAEFINRFQPDIVFADIEMPGITGLQLIRKLTWQPPAVVFTTSHPEFALEGFEVEAFDYLLKPIQADRFAACANRLKDFLTMRAKAGVFDSEQQSGSIVIKQGYDKCKLRLAEIHYIEAMKDYIRIVAASGQYLVLETLGRMQDRLAGAGFIRIHRSYLVSREKITGIMGNRIIVAGMELPVGKLFKHSLDEVL